MVLQLLRFLLKVLKQGADAYCIVKSEDKDLPK